MGSAPRVNIIKHFSLYLTSSQNKLSPKTPPLKGSLYRDKCPSLLAASDEESGFKNVCTRSQSLKISAHYEMS